MKHKPRTTKQRKERAFPEIPPEVHRLVRRINEVCDGENALHAALATGLLFGEGIYRATKFAPRSREADEGPVMEFLEELRTILRVMMRGIRDATTESRKEPK